MQNSIDNLQDNVNIIAKTAASSVRKMNFLPQGLLSLTVSHCMMFELNTLSTFFKQIIFGNRSSRFQSDKRERNSAFASCQRRFDLHYRTSFVNRNSELPNRMPMSLARSCFDELMTTVSYLDLVPS